MNKFTIPLISLAVATSATAAEPTIAELMAELEQLRTRIVELETQVADNQAARQPIVTATHEGTQSSVPSAPIVPAQASPFDGLGNVSSKFAIDLYGYIKLDAIASSQDTLTDTIPFWVRQSNGSNDDGQFNMTAKETRLGAKLNGPDFADGKVTGLAEFDFYGDFADTSTRHAYEMRSRHLYLKYSKDDWSILAGKTWETYLTTFPKTLNFSYYNLMGQLGLRRTQVRFTKDFAFDDVSKLTAKLAVAEPLGGLHGGDVDGDAVDDGHDSDMPQLQYNFTYSTPLLTEKASKFSLAGFVGEEAADIDGNGSDEDYDSYAVIGGLELPLTDKLTLKGTIWTGTNVDSAWGGIAQGINATTRETVDANGGWAQLNYKATDKLSLNLGYSTDNPDDDHLNDGGRTQNTSYLINALYSFTPEFILGFEYMHLETDYKGASSEETDWLQSSLIYKF